MSKQEDTDVIVVGGGGSGLAAAIEARTLSRRVVLLEKNPKPNDAQIREALSGLKCRCGTHVAILRAVKRAAQA